MGTRSITVFKDGAEEIAVMYRQFDGGLQRHGLELAKFLKPMRFINGFGANDRAGEVAVDMECLSAQIIAHFKAPHQVPGGFYLLPAGSREHDEEFIYYVNAGYCSVRKLTVPYIVAQTADGATLFEGPAADMVASIEQAQSSEQ